MAFEYPSTKTAKREKKEKEEQAKIEKVGKTFDKKFAKYAGSKEAHLHAKDFDEGVIRAANRAISETKHKYKLKMKAGGIASGMRRFNRGGKV